jgi:transcriptional regulator with XRE-family HTH domain
MKLAIMPPLHIAAPPRQDIFGRLQEIRLAWKLSASEVGERIGVKGQTLTSWERGNTTPQLYQLIRWAAVLGYELNLWPKGQSH